MTRNGGRAQDDGDHCNELPNNGIQDSSYSGPQQAFKPDT
jgi:hypothetical protein